jgi:hypothetical protein
MGKKLVQPELASISKWATAISATTQSIVDSLFASIRVSVALMAATSFNEIFGQVSANEGTIQSAIATTYIVSMGLSSVLLVRQRHYAIDNGIDSKPGRRF